MIMRESVACRVPRRSLLAVAALALLTVPGWSLGDPPAPATIEEPAQKQPYRITVAEDVNDFEVILDWLDDPQDKSLGREERLAKIEAQIQAMLKEIQALKSEKGAKRATNVRDLASKALVDAAQARLTQKRDTDSVRARVALGEHVLRGGNEVVLYRVGYALPHARAEALARFLNENIKTGIVECAVEGEKLTVTTTPENQALIGKLVQLVQDRPAAPKK
jgi:hypothetical protein